MTGKHASPGTRFWRRVRKSKGCWEWQGFRSKFGYGRLRVAANGPGSIVTAHRFSWTVHFGDIPDGMWVLHRCDNPGCVRPTHLFLGTHGDNMEDCRLKGRRPVMAGTKNGGVKINETTALKIRRDIRSVRQIAQDYDIGKSMVSNIKRGVNWAHLQR